jgi:ABC-2 type transport system ATP-binding protein
METLAYAKNLTVQYGINTAVDNVSFEIKAGEILAVIGPNGSGKTSTVECLEGLRRPTGGVVSVFGKDPLVSRKEIYRKLGVQLQDTSYPEKIKVEELCAWFASFYEAPADYNKMLEQLDLTVKRKRYVSKLSGGEKQRLSIILALIPRPKMLILDELTTGLDPEVRRNIWESLKVIRDSGVGVLLVSHYMDEVETLADRIMFMLEGKTIYIGTLGGFREYARETLPHEQWQSEMPLEDIYLAFVPKKNRITMEGIS